jgi:large subunit ribosomal protein L21
MFAYIQTGGKQYKVKIGDVIDVELLGVDDGAEISFEEILMLRDPEAGAAQIGRPVVEGASVKGKIVGTVKGEKVISYKFKRRQNYQRKVGHRQKYSRVEITSIAAA